MINEIKITHNQLDEMERKPMRTIQLEKENDHKNMNKRDESLNKMDRFLMIKQINHHDPKDKIELKTMRNSKELRQPTKSLHEKCNKLELKPINDQLTNTQQFCLLYAADVLKHSEACKETLGSFLQNHDIDKQLRARMLDWMVEVTSSYKFNAKTYFSSVYLMDRYFKQEQNRLPITKLHIAGVTAMLIATKMDEVYPLKIKTVYQKIVHKKIEKKDLVDMESRITNKLDFFLNVWSFFDFAILKLHENWQIKSEEVLKEIELICECIGKFIVFNYELYGHYDMGVMAESLLRAAFKVYGTEKIRCITGEKQPLDLDISKDCLVCMELIFETIKTFKSNFRNLNNIYKFGDAGALQKVDEYIKNY